MRLFLFVLFWISALNCAPVSFYTENSWGDRDENLINSSFLNWNFYRVGESGHKWGVGEGYGRLGIEQDSKRINDHFIYPTIGGRYFIIPSLFLFTEGRVAFLQKNDGQRSMGDFRVGVVFSDYSPLSIIGNLALDNYAEYIYSTRAEHNAVLDWKFKFLYRLPITPSNSWSLDTFIQQRFLNDFNKFAYNNALEYSPGLRLNTQQKGWGSSLLAYHAWRYNLKKDSARSRTQREFRTQWVLGMEF